MDEFQTYSAPEPIHNGLWRFLLRTVRETLGTIIPALIMALFINLFLAQATIVQGQSMEPTLHASQRLVIEKLTYRLLHGPRHGDVVVLRVPRLNNELLIKRVVALPGETIESRAGKLVINNQPVTEEWGTLPDGINVSRTTVPPLNVFVLGDNRGASNDSRSFGPVPIDDIVGRALFSYWPPEQVGFVK